ncbi:MAG: glycosyltransferase family 39 protein [Microgenomates group bacterium]
MKWYYWAAIAVIIVSSFALGLHNASIYAPNHGFDGSGHVYYIRYLAEKKEIPPPTEWETHQPPLYYIIGALVMSAAGNFRAAHYINIFILWMIIGVVGLGLRTVFKDKDQILLGMFALAALPMLNIFPAMITNELLSTLFIIAAAVAALYMIKAKSKKELLHNGVRLGICLVLGIWTKLSIITILPTLLVALIIILRKQTSKRIYVSIMAVVLIIAFVAASTPIFLRGMQTKSPSNITVQISSLKKTPREPAFYYRLDWIPKVDMYNTQYYSLLGGAWNSFWSDGHNVITPFIKFHKKAFILWTLGFILLPISLMGLWNIWKKHKEASFVINTIGLLMLAMYVLYNIMSNHYSAARLTYEMAIVVPYAFGIAGAATNKKMKIIILGLLSVQFIILLSFYWILPWWHVTR